MRCIGELAHPLKKAKRLKNCCIGAYADPVVAFLDAKKRRARCEGALGDDARWQAPPPPGVTDVCSQVAQGLPDGDGWAVRCWHNVNFAFH
jgi:hypothetical protein